jgi:hypothetical protein
VNGAMMSLHRILAMVLHPPHLKRTSAVALALGIWLSLFNVGEQLLAGPWNLPLVIKIAMNVLTPFMVANACMMSRQAGLDPDAEK